MITPKAASSRCASRRCALQPVESVDQADLIDCSRIGFAGLHPRILREFGDANTPSRLMDSILRRMDPQRGAPAAPLLSQPRSVPQYRIDAGFREGSYGLN